MNVEAGRGRLGNFFKIFGQLLNLRVNDDLAIAIVPIIVIEILMIILGSVKAGVGDYFGHHGVRVHF